eukprot:jgi/Mesen1/6304/ME000325S05442
MRAGIDREMRSTDTLSSGSSSLQQTSILHEEMESLSEDVSRLQALMGGMAYAQGGEGGMPGLLLQELASSWAHVAASSSSSTWEPPAVSRAGGGADAEGSGNDGGGRAVGSESGPGQVSPSNTPVGRLQQSPGVPDRSPSLLE